MKPYYNNESKTIFLGEVINNPLIISREKQIHNLTIEQTKKFKDTKYNVYLTAISQEEVDLIDSYKKLNKEDKEKASSKLPLIIEHIVMYGNANKRKLSIEKLSTFLEKIYKNRYRLDNNSRIEIYYRNYEKRQESWEESSCFINSCPDAKMSWQSALRKLGAKGVHGIHNNYEDFNVVLWYDSLPVKEAKKLWQL